MYFPDDVWRLILSFQLDYQKHHCKRFAKVLSFVLTHRKSTLTLFSHTYPPSLTYRGRVLYSITYDPVKEWYALWAYEYTENQR